MVDFDPANQNVAASARLQNAGGTPTVAGLKAAIAGSAFAARYPASFMHAATRNDLIYVCSLHGIAVAGLSV